MKILILCTGNSCRSQMAAGFLKSFDSRMEVQSAGTDPAPRVNERAIKIMAEEGIDISGEMPKSSGLFTGDTWDFVITVCDEANESCPVFTGRVKHRIHMGFEDPSKTRGTEEYIMSEFRRARELIKSEFYKFYESEIRPLLP